METNYKENLAAIDSIFYNQTLKYCTNGFAEACGMHDLQNVINNVNVVEKEKVFSKSK